jgi:hypothetical protein
MVAAGLLARNARRRGLKAQPWVKTSLSPGSRVVADYLRASGLQADLDALGFQVTGFGCMSCMGNSGPLPEAVGRAIEERGLATVAVLSGNRNFDARIHASVRAHFLASPPLVVAYALAGSINTDLTCEPLGADPQGQPVYLRDLWPDDGKGLFYRDLVEVFGEAVRTLGDAPCAGPAWGWIGLKPAIMEQYLQLSSKGSYPDQAGMQGITHLIWPETSFPFLLEREPEALAQIATLLGPGVQLLTGAVRAEDSADGFERLFYNTIQVVDGDGRITARADKVHLVPFGE